MHKVNNWKQRNNLHIKKFDDIGIPSVLKSNTKGSWPETYSHFIEKVLVLNFFVDVKSTPKFLMSQSLEAWQKYIHM